MMRLRAVLAIGLLLLSQVAIADQGYDDGEDQQFEEEQQDEPEEEEEQAQEVANDGYQYNQNDDGNQANYNVDDYGDYKTQIEVCSDGVVQVRDIQIYCDSPGTFYYGSGKYRNSASCAPGDKGVIQIDLYIAQPDIIMNNGGYVLVDVSASGGWGIGSKTVYEHADLCSLSTLSSKKGQCPYEGYYYIKTHFYWDKNDGSSSSKSFYPTVTVGFKSGINANSYDYGGANTDSCSGGSFITWSDGIATVYANAIGNFMKSFGILLITVCCLGAFIWILAKRPTSFRDAVQKLSRKRNGLLDDEFDFSKMRRGRQDQDIVDF